MKNAQLCYSLHFPFGDLNFYSLRNIFLHGKQYSALTPFFIAVLVMKYISSEDIFDFE